MKRIAILGSFSGRNKGDLAILRAELLQIKKRAKEPLLIYIFTKDTKQIRQYLSDVTEDQNNGRKLDIVICRAFTTCLGPKTLPVLAKCDKIIIGGGGLFFDKKLFNISISQLLNLFILTPILRMLHKDYMIFAAGCSDLNSETSRRMTGVVLNGAGLVTVRDELSRSILRDCTDKQILLGADPAFLLKPRETDAAKKIVRSWPAGPKILLSMHRQLFVVRKAPAGKDALKRFLTIIGGFADRNGWHVLTCTNHTDQSLAAEIAEFCGRNAAPALKGDNHLLPEELIYLFSAADFVIASRMHACMFAYLAGVPFLSIPYAQKADEFNRLVGNGNILHIQDMTDREKVERSLRTVADAEPLPQNETITKRAMSLFDVLMDFIYDRA